MNSKHTLLIDDNEVDNYISQHIILKSKMSEKVTVKSSALEALEYLHTLKSNPEESPDLIFLDIRMPEMDGFGFLDEFNKFPDAIKNHCIIYMLTSSNDSNDITKSLQYPIVKKYLNKPLSMSILQSL